MSKYKWEVVDAWWLLGLTKNIKMKMSEEIDKWCDGFFFEKKKYVQVSSFYSLVITCKSLI